MICLSRAGKRPRVYSFALLRKVAKEHSKQYQLRCCVWRLRSWCWCQRSVHFLCLDVLVTSPIKLCFLFAKSCAFQRRVPEMCDIDQVSSKSHDSLLGSIMNKMRFAARFRIFGFNQKTFSFSSIPDLLCFPNRLRFMLCKAIWFASLPSQGNAAFRERLVGSMLFTKTTWLCRLSAKRSFCIWALFAENAFMPSPRPTWDSLVLSDWWSVVATIDLLSTRGNADSEIWDTPE